eukprot:m.69188 g.69188  ORF g.69188 m.69188 type:complete len:107 (+) comp24060_c0_seq4:252-572(+)
MGDDKEPRLPSVDDESIKRTAATISKNLNVTADFDFQDWATKNLFLSGMMVGLVLSKFTLRNATGASLGVLGGMWYQQEIGAPDIKTVFGNVRDEINDKSGGNDGS